MTKSTEQGNESGENLRIIRSTVPELIRRLQQTYPDAHCELEYKTPVQLLVATILSAQCTDARVNQVTPALFKRYPTAVEFAEADRVELETLIRPTGFFRQKAKYIQESAQVLVHRYGGAVPDEMDRLLELPGVARKTANVVLGEIYGKAEGITVDTHVRRLANRLGLSDARDPVKIEKTLMKLVPRHGWISLSHLLIYHGRRRCTARRPACAGCPLIDLCPSAGIPEV